eukprot:1032848-Amphidinium_carterae.1
MNDDDLTANTHVDADDGQQCYGMTFVNNMSEFMQDDGVMAYMNNAADWCQHYHVFPGDQNMFAHPKDDDLTVNLRLDAVGGQNDSGTTFVNNMFESVQDDGEKAYLNLAAVWSESNNALPLEQTNWTHMKDAVLIVSTHNVDGNGWGYASDGKIWLLLTWIYGSIVIQLGLHKSTIWLAVKWSQQFWWALVGFAASTLVGSKWIVGTVSSKTVS